MIRFILFTLVLVTYCESFVFADNLPANNCQIYIRRIQAQAGSHGSSSLGVIVKVNWLGNDEQIQNVGFMASNNDIDLGNRPGFCSWSLRPQNTWYIQNSVAPEFSYGSTEYGEYKFIFSISSGSVTSTCGGYQYSTLGTFFVKTNKNTYWLNPDMNSSNYFYFDANGFDNIVSKGGMFSFINTDRADLSYYNPLKCK